MLNGTILRNRYKIIKLLGRGGLSRSCGGCGVSIPCPLHSSPLTLCPYYSFPFFPRLRRKKIFQKTNQT
ncbi:hypothetical protein H6G41_18605 [Tolypothrix sp. FACHB-123]|uniref:hypothetical protein n=1 Tax=Tolypothrix sp. FACHB-123 TaxID=2692868 RepID=UPI00168A1AEE|nr:hypothetical protein [Tolypothrix sp. FACHB-123]MBD2356611.1 hypothetical protein [Tolypothrix sp. FACHB-123]